MTTRARPLLILLASIAIAVSTGCSGGDEGVDAPVTSTPSGASTTPDASGIVKTTGNGGAKASTATLAIDAGAGAVHYERLCALCHGKEGRGDTPMAKMLNPPPRGFVDEPWRFIEPGTPEQERSGVERVIRQGLPDSGMPGYAGQLTDEQIAQVAAYVMAFRDIAD